MKCLELKTDRPMKYKESFSNEILLYILAFGIAIAVRFYGLGSAPLSDSEAEWALQALMFANPQANIGGIALSPNPGYVFLTAALFAIFGSSNFLARLWPAIAGPLLVFVPLLFVRYSERTGRHPGSELRWASIILAFGLALAPALVTVSRLAGGPMMALGFSLLAIGLWFIRKPVLAGISAGIAVISGPTLFIGIFGLVLAWLVVKALFKGSSQYGENSTDTVITESNLATSDSEVSNYDQQEGSDLRAFFVAAAGSLIFIGTMILVYPQGIGAWVGSFPAYLKGWTDPSGIPITRMLAALFTYETAAVLFSLVFILVLLIRWNSTIKRDRRMVIFLIAWVVFGLFIALIYPGRQIQDLVWVIFPLWALAALGVANLLYRKPVTMISLLQAIIILVLAGLLWYTIASTTRNPDGIAGAGFQLAIILGILALGALTTALITLGWSWDISRSGLVLGLLGALILYLTSVLWSSAYIRQNLPHELWSSTPAPEQAHLMEKVLKEVSSWNTGTQESMDIVSTVDTPSLRWALRDFTEVRFISSPGTDELPSIVITREGEELPMLTASYRGEDFVWWSIPGWSGALPQDFARWFAFREAPLIREKIIIWSRSDLFPSSSLNQNPLEAPAENLPIDGSLDEAPIIDNPLIEGIPEDDAR